MIGLTGLLNAQLNIEMASKTQHIANQTVIAGRLRVRQGLTDGNPDAIKEGEALQEKGEEIRNGVFEHIGNAIKDINAVAKENEEASQEREEPEKTEEKDKNSSDNHGNIHGELDIVVGDTVIVRRSGNTSVPAGNQSDAGTGEAVKVSKKAAAQGNAAAISIRV